MGKSTTTISPADIVSKTKSELTGTDADMDLITNSIEQIENTDIVTDQNRCEVMAAVVQLMDLFIEKFPSASDAASNVEIRDKINNLLFAYYGENTLNLKLVQLIIDLQIGIASGGSPEQLAQNALNTISSLPFTQTEFDIGLRSRGIAQVIALKLAAEYWIESKQDKKAENEIDSILTELQDYLLKNGFDREKILAANQQLEESGAKLTQDINELNQAFITVYGLGLLVNPQTGPALEPLQEKLTSLVNYFIDQSAIAKETSIAAEQTPKNGDQIVAAFKELVARDGFTEYSLELAITEIKNLPLSTEEEYSYFNKTMNDVLDVAIQFAPENHVEALKIAKTELSAMANQVNDPPEELTALQLKSLSHSITADLKKNLEAGEPLEAAFTRAMFKIQSLIPRLSEKEEEEANESAQILVHSMMVDMFQSIKDYIPEDKKELWPQLQAMMGLADEATQSIGADEPEEEIMMQRFEEQLNRVLYTANNIPLSPLAENTPFIKQFVALFPALAARFSEFKIESNTEDEREYKRLMTHLDDTLRLLSTAYSLKQILQHQKINFRRMALELGQFERRQFLMIAKPVFPANDVAFDANTVFYSGSGHVAELVVKACVELEMTVSVRKITDSYVNARWQQVRESGIAVFDYSNFNPTVADPDQGAIPTAPEEAEVLDAAGPVANVAYENGWAYALGKPMVIIKKKDQPLPFDIDIDPVELQDDGQDAARIVAAMQIALYGVSRAAKGTCLPETIDFVNFFYSTVKNPKIKSILRALDDTKEDASKIRLFIASLLTKNTDQNQLLIIPAFPGSYPTKKRKLVFHVSAFRKWSKATQDVLKSICKKRKLDYTIGYERLNPNIMASIWKDISQSSFVIADITNLNPNAALELAMAQVIGCPVLIISQNKEPHKYFLPIQKTRTHYYNPVESKQGLIELTENFFDGME